VFVKSRRRDAGFLENLRFVSVTLRSHRPDVLSGARENFYGTDVLVGTGVREATGVFVGRRVGDGGTVFVGVDEGNAVGVTISFAR
jgi:hypothetical protein